jgi:hypothetical protein
MINRPGPKHVWIHKIDFAIFEGEPIDKKDYTKYIKAPPEKQK